MRRIVRRDQRVEEKERKRKEGKEKKKYCKFEVGCNAEFFRLKVARALRAQCRFVRRVDYHRTSVLGSLVCKYSNFPHDAVLIYSKDLLELPENKQRPRAESNEAADTNHK